MPCEIIINNIENSLKVSFYGNQQPHIQLTVFNNVNTIAVNFAIVAFYGKCVWFDLFVFSYKRIIRNSANESLVFCKYCFEDFVEKYSNGISDSIVVFSFKSRKFYTQNLLVSITSRRYLVFLVLALKNYFICRYKIIIPFHIVIAVSVYCYIGIFAVNLHS